MQIEWPLICGILAAWTVPSLGGQVPGFDSNPPPPQNIVPQDLWDECKVHLAYKMTVLPPEKRDSYRLDLPKELPKVKAYVNCLGKLIDSILDQFHLLNDETFEYFFGSVNGLLAQTRIKDYRDFVQTYGCSCFDKVQLLPFDVRFKTSLSLYDTLEDGREFGGFPDYNIKWEVARYRHSVFSLKSIGSAITKFYTTVEVSDDKALNQLDCTLNDLHNGYYESLSKYFARLRGLLKLTKGTDFCNSLVRKNLGLGLSDKLLSDLEPSDDDIGSWTILHITCGCICVVSQNTTGTEELMETLSCWRKQIHILFWSEAYQLLRDYAIVSVCNLSPIPSSGFQPMCDAALTQLGELQTEMDNLILAQRALVKSLQNEQLLPMDYSIDKNLKFPECFNRLVTPLCSVTQLLYALLQKSSAQCFSPTLVQNMLNLHRSCLETTKEIVNIFDLARATNFKDICAASGYYEKLFPVVGQLLALEQVVDVYRKAHEALARPPNPQGDSVACDDWDLMEGTLASNPTIDALVDSLFNPIRDWIPTKRASHNA